MSFLTPSLKAFIKKHADEDVRKLALCVKELPSEDLKEALRQIEGRQKAKIKLPTWANNEDIVFPVQLSMEQCSSETTAKYKADLLENGSEMADLTGGFGIDFYYLSEKFKTAHYVERDPVLCNIVEHNLNVTHRSNFTINNEDAQVFLNKASKRYDFIFIDPARRDANGRKTVAPSDCLPNLTLMQNQLKAKAKKVMVKYSPMLDLNTALKELINVESIHIVSVNNECKELLLLQNFENSSINGPLISCIDFVKGQPISISAFLNEEKMAKAVIAKQIGAYIYEPNSAIMKAGLYKTVANKFGLEQIQANSHLYTSDQLTEKFPGRSFVVKGISKMNRKDLYRTFPNVKQANIAVRNCPLKPEEIRAKLKIKEGGDFYIFATTLSNNDIVLIGCTKA